MRKIIAVILTLLLVNLLVAQTVTNAVPLVKGEPAPFDSVALTREYANTTLDKLRFYTKEYPIVASNLDCALYTIRGLDQELKLATNYIPKVQSSLKATEELLKQAQAKLAKAKTIGEVLFAIGFVTGVLVIVGAVILAGELSKSYSLVVTAK